MNLKEQIENYIPYNEQEEKDKETILKYMNTFDDVLTRDNEFAHFTASSWAVNKEKTKGVEVVKGGKGGKNTVDAVTGATISSRAVNTAVTEALENFEAFSVATFIDTEVTVSEE